MIDPQIAADARTALNDISSAALSAQNLMAQVPSWMVPAADKAAMDDALAKIADAQQRLVDIIDRAAAAS